MHKAHMKYSNSECKGGGYREKGKAEGRGGDGEGEGRIKEGRGLKMQPAPLGKFLNYIYSLLDSV